MKTIQKLFKKSGHSILDEENYMVEKSQQFFEELEHLTLAEKELEESEGDQAILSIDCSSLSYINKMRDRQRESNIF
jgi:hypothetical protein